MKKWEYMEIISQEGKVRYVNGKQLKDFEIPFSLANSPALGTDSIDFYNMIGKKGWEAVSNTLFKRELKEEKKED